MPRGGHGRLHLQADPPGGAAAPALARGRRRAAIAAPAADGATHDRRPHPRRRRHRRSTGGCSSGCSRAIGHETVEAERRPRGARPCCATPTRRPDRRRPARHRHAEMDGYETLAALKADDALRDLPVIVISGVDELDSVVRCIQMGAADYLPKTVDPEILRARIEASLAQKRLHDWSARRWPSRHGCSRRSTASARELSRFLSPQVAALVSSDGRRGDAGRPPARDHRDVLRPAQLHGLLRDGRARGGARLPARLSRRDGRADRRARGHARALRGRRVHDVLQRPGAPARPRRAGRRAWRSRCASAFVGAGGRLAAARPRARDRDRDRDRLRDAGPDRVRGPLRLRRHRQRDHPRLAAQRRGGARRDPHRAADLRGGRSGGRGDLAGERQLKGFSRPVPTYAVDGVRDEETIA